jgi:DNA invertase Pin-like site-specific DNA recombinase
LTLCGSTATIDETKTKCRSDEEMIYIYQRVSTKRQRMDRQEFVFDMSNIKADKVYSDKISGAKADRPQLNQLKLDVKDGDKVFIESISRSGRNVDDLRELCRYFKEKGVTVQFMKEGFNTDGNMYQFLLTILGAVAEMERDLIRGRVIEGLENAMVNGTKSGNPVGRPKRELPRNFNKYYEQWRAKDITATEFAKLLQCSRQGLYNYIKLYEQR